jgi:hypothetical protein
MRNVLTKKEAIAIENVDFFKIKKDVFGKIENKLSLLEEKLHQIAIKNNFLPEEVLRQRGKISRGENLQQMPYMVLDYPRFFDRENIFAFRTLFWWGKFVSFNLHLSGRYCEQFSETILQNIKKNIPPQTYWYVNAHPWHHDFTSDNYLLIKKENTKTILPNENTFLKISRKLNLDKIELIEKEGEKSFEIFLKLLQ